MFSLDLLSWVTKICVITVKGLEPATSCVRPGCCHSASKTHVRDRIFKLSPIHASVIYQIPWIRWIRWIPVSFRETPLSSGCLSLSSLNIRSMDVTKSTGNHFAFQPLYKLREIVQMWPSLPSSRRHELPRDILSPLNIILLSCTCIWKNNNWPKSFY